jgi:hypothetical protein
MQKIKSQESQVCCFTLVIPAPRRLRQQDFKLEISLCCLARLGLKKKLKSEEECFKQFLSVSEFHTFMPSLFRVPKFSKSP